MKREGEKEIKTERSGGEKDRKRKEKEGRRRVAISARERTMGEQGGNKRRGDPGYGRVAVYVYMPACTESR